ncbi:MAG: J domain-containing protein [Clostridia bacterium]|nr:J domain-containing protein [Clostridia bacterium]
MNDPYKVLGISPNATDDEVKNAYRELAKKYHPDNYGDNPLSDLAEEKMQEINEAYDAIIRMRRQGAAGGAASHTGYTGQSSGTRYADIRNLIRLGRTIDAETLLDGIPAPARDAEWYFLKGSVLYKKGWLDDAHNHFSTANRMDPSNPEYRAAFQRMEQQRYTGGYRAGPSAHDMNNACTCCNNLLCADCCCECMGGDLIPCC